MKKITSIVLMITIVLYLLLVNFTPILSEELKNNTLFVDDDGNSDYITIKDAINDASDGDSIYVYSGIYEGYFIINKSLKITAEDKYNTIIDGMINNTNFTSIIKINADNVTLSGFTIKNSIRGNISYPFEYYDYGIGIGIFSNNNKISSNIIQKNEGYGILLNNSNSNKIFDNNFSYNEEACIYFKNSSFNHLISNNFFNNSRGIIFSINSTNNTIFYNNFINNTLYNAYTKSNNTFYNDSIKKGNFWDDYNGTDENYDNIGDIVYIINGEISKDKYPLMKPYNEYVTFIVNYDDVIKMLVYGMVLAVIICIPIAYLWRKKYFT